MSRTWRGEWQQAGMGYPRAPQQNEAFSLMGGFRGKILEVFDKNTPDRNGKPMGFTHCTVQLDFGLPRVFRVPLKREKLNMTEGEDIPPEKGDWVVVIFLHGNIDLPLIDGFIAPPQNEGVNTVETEKVATEPQLHRHWKDTDWRSDKDHNWIESFPKDHRRRVKKEIHDAGDDKRYIKTKDVELHEAKGIATKVKEDDALKADRILRKAVTLVQFSAPRIEMGGTTQESGATFKEGQVGDDGKIAPQADEPQPDDPLAGTAPPSTPVTGTGTGQDVVNAASSQQGAPYGWGGAGHNGTYDCSGLYDWSTKKAGAVPQDADRLTAQGYFDSYTPVASNQVQAGDAVFFGEPGDVRHMGIVEDPAAHTMIHAPRPGRVVSEGRYNPNTVAGFRRPS